MDKLTISLLVKMIANQSIGSSTLRGQGAKGVVKIARNYLSEMKISEFSESKTIEDFAKVLEKNTKRLKRAFPEGARNWGTARKAINIFLRDIVYNKHTNSKFVLSHIEKWLEVPLDSHTAQGIRNTSLGKHLPRWKTIKSLTEQDNSQYQLAAQNLANKLGINRIDLDIYFWRKVGEKYIKTA